MSCNTSIVESHSEIVKYFAEIMLRIDNRLNHILQEKKLLEGEQDWGGLYISETEIQKLLDSSLMNQGDECMERCWFECKLPLHYRFDRMVGLCQLNWLDQWILYVVMAPLLDAKYNRIYGYLHDNMGRSLASLYILYLLLAENFKDRVSILERLSEDAPLIRYGLIESVGLDHGQEALKISPVILDFLLGKEPVEIFGFPILYFQRADDVNPVSEEPTVVCQDTIVYLLGDQSVDVQHQYACQLSHEWARSLIEVDAEELRKQNLSEGSSRFESVCICAALYGFVICLKNLELLLSDNVWNAVIRRLFKRSLFSIQWILMGHKLMDYYGQLSFCFPQKRLLELRLPTLDYEARKDLWMKLLPDALCSHASLLAERFELDRNTIHKAVCIAMENVHSGEINLDDILNGVHRCLGRLPNNRLQRVQTLFDWSDLILPEKCLQHLHQVEVHIRYLERVRREWNFSHRVPTKGISVMFCGDSGVGKTMSAAILAKSLKIDLYRVDVSQVISKYIGETEKHISEIFDIAEATGAALFFDEADALLGRRTEVGDSHDRYANLETSFLLQKMEYFGGLTILATNLRQNIDTAFLRRIHSIVEFPFPSPKERRRMWESMFPKGTPLGDDIDFDWLAKNVVLSGGHLHHVTLEAAVQAMAESEPVCLRHIEYAVLREYEKLQKTSVTIDWAAKKLNGYNRTSKELSLRNDVLPVKGDT